MTALQTGQIPTPGTLLNLFNSMVLLSGVREESKRTENCRPRTGKAEKLTEAEQEGCAVGTGEVGKLQKRTKSVMLHTN